MRKQFDRRRQRWALVALAGGAALFGLSAANGHGWETVWLPAVLLGTAWPSESNGKLRRCLRRLRRPSRRDDDGL